MSYLTTELLTSLLRGGTAANEFLRSKIEEGVNAVLKAELAGFLGYEKHSSAGWHTGNSRNGSYQRTIVTSYGKITVDVPRDRNGEFQSPLLPTRKQRVDSLETTIIQLYQRGVTTRQIAELIEQMYGHCYTPATISTIAANVSDQVEQFHKRPVAKRYAVIFCDAMYVNLRRDSEAKESIHVLLGITPEGHKEILDYAILPSESALNYADMLKSLKTRGLEQVLLFVSDGLVGLSDAVQNEFPRARHQSCWVHLMRAVSRLVRPSDRKIILDALKRVYRQENATLARQELSAFLNSYGTKYKRLHKLFRMSSASSRFTSFRRASGRQSTRQTSSRTTTKDFVTRQSSRSNSPMRILWNDSPARSTVIITDDSLGKHIADFKKHIQSCWKCSRINFFVLHYKVYT